MEYLGSQHKQRKALFVMYKSMINWPITLGPVLSCVWQRKVHSRGISQKEGSRMPRAYPLSLYI